MQHHAAFEKLKRIVARSGLRLLCLTFSKYFVSTLKGSKLIHDYLLLPEITTVHLSVHLHKWTVKVALG